MHVEPNPTLASLQDQIEKLYDELAQRDDLVERLTAENKRLREAPVMPFLDDRERDILSRMARHQTAREIARDLCYSEATIRKALKVIYGKLDVGRKADAIVEAWKLGLIEIGEPIAA
ncbi:MAG TPA: LuxR C-terminal-related transcriptional regulator [Solirubrobacter sp.]|nr:LuxR C-terminal-related transcriptional regulator [Solirubrobacter sp.]